MKCSNCGKKIECCDQCGRDFEEEDDVYCYNGELHFCSAECLLDYLIEEGNVVWAEATEKEEVKEDIKFE